tara:strand:+ start:110 stop:661 length:552 start_codon:yes stop_codon:yes gene_type:complete
MKKIYFIRHGEGYHNLRNYDYHNFHLEYPRLTVKGLKQCFELKKKLDEDKFDYIIVSPLRRTLETAASIFDKNNHFIAMESIREFVSNPCDYRESLEGILKEYNFVDFGLIDDNYDYNKKEEDIDINLRMESFYTYLTNTPFEKIAVVSHGEFLKRFFKKYGKKLNIRDIEWMENCGLEIGYL